MTRLEVSKVRSPIGAVTLVWRAQTLCALDFEDRWAQTASKLTRRFEGAAFADGDRGRSEVLAYLDGDMRAFDDFDVDPGGTPFQAEVWQALRTIAAGATWSYGQLARALGRPGAARAVGLANSKNPISIVIPCHRVIGSNGALTGYAGGVDRKLWLLEHEGALLT